MCRDHQKKTTKKEDRDEQRGVPNVLPYEALKALVKNFKNALVIKIDVNSKMISNLESLGRRAIMGY